MTVQHREPFPHLLGRLERLDDVDARAVLEGILGLLPHPAGGLLSYHDSGHRWLSGDSPRDRVRNLLPSAFEASVRVLHPLQNGQGPRGGRMLWKDLADSRRLPAPGARFVDLFPDELLQERRVEPRVGHLDPLTAILLSRILEHHTTQPEQVLFVFWGGLSFFQEDEVDPVYRGPLAVVDAIFTNDPRPWHLTPTICSIRQGAGG